MKILFSFLPKSEQQANLLEEFPEVEFIFHKGLDENELKSADIFVTYGEDIELSHLETAKQLKWIMVASAGLEKMPLKEIAARDIVVTNVRGIHKIPMAESIIAHILSIKKCLPLVAENQKQKVWFRRVQSFELHGSTALIIGPGAIGGEVGRILQAFGVKTIGCNRSGYAAPYMDEMTSFERIADVLPLADIVISILPSTEETKGLLTYEHFQSMKPSAIFMNYGRGDVVKETDILQAMQKECIAYAVLDVFENEPLGQDHPFWEMDNVIISPHISSHSSQYLVRALEIFSKNLNLWSNENKELENIIVLEKGY
jgi:phosphoglycerate dehydrogenase-like enzyme